jgi:hypothetical protein
MRRFLTVITAVFAVAALGSMVSAQGSSQPRSSEKTVEKSATVVAKAEPLSTTGKVEKVDVSARKFTVKITAGAKTEKAEDMKGKNVKVTYTVADGKNLASKVTIASEQKPQAETGKKVEKKDETKK